VHPTLLSEVPALKAAPKAAVTGSEEVEPQQEQIMELEVDAPLKQQEGERQDLRESTPRKMINQSR